MLFFYFEDTNRLEAPYAELCYNKRLAGANNYFLYTAKLPLPHTYKRTAPLKHSILSAKHQRAPIKKIGFSERSPACCESTGRGTITLKQAV